MWATTVHPAACQQGHQAARRFLGVAAALRLPGDHPGHFGKGEAAGPSAGSVACTVPTARPVARTRITQLPHPWSPPGERRCSSRW